MTNNKCKCPYCRESFSRQLHGQRKFCSAECRLANVEDQRQAKLAARGPLPEIRLECRQCDEVFWSQNRRKEFCSKSCRDKARWPRRKVPKAQRPCAVCAKLFTPNKDRHRYCSSDCKSNGVRANTLRCRALNRKKDRAYRHDYYKRNKKHHDATVREWFKNNPIKVSAFVHRRRARKANAQGSHTCTDLETIWHKQSGRCANPYCATKLTKKTRRLDHKKALACGGSNYPRNLQWMCGSCNSRKNTKPWSVFLAEEALLLGRSHNEQP